MPTSPRRFTLLDAMIAVGVVAVAMAATRWKYAGYAWFWNLDREGWSPGATARSTCDRGGLRGAADATSPRRSPWPRLELTPPRFPPLRRIALQPGAAACGWSC